MKNKTHKDIVRKISNMNPYKEEGNRESYSSYNEGWSDACDVILSEIIESEQEQGDDIIDILKVIELINRKL